MGVYDTIVLPIPVGNVYDQKRKESLQFYHIQNRKQKPILIQFRVL